MRRAPWIAAFGALALGSSLASAQPPANAAPEKPPLERLLAYLDASPVWTPAPASSPTEKRQRNAALIGELHNARMVEVTGELKAADGAILPINFSQMTSGGAGHSPSLKSGKALAERIDFEGGRSMLRVGLQVLGESFIIGPVPISPARSLTTELPGGHSVTLSWTLRPLTEVERAETFIRAVAVGREDVISDAANDKATADKRAAVRADLLKRRPEMIRQAGLVGGLTDAAIDKLIADADLPPTDAPTLAMVLALNKHAMATWPRLRSSDMLSPGLGIDRMIGVFTRADGKVAWINQALCGGNSTNSSALTTGDLFAYRIVREKKQYRLLAEFEFLDGQIVEAPPTTLAENEVKRVTLPGGDILTFKVARVDGPPKCMIPR